MANDVACDQDRVERTLDRLDARLRALDECAFCPDGDQPDPWLATASVAVRAAEVLAGYLQPSVEFRSGVIDELHERFRRRPALGDSGRGGVSAGLHQGEWFLECAVAAVMAAASEPREPAQTG